MRCPIRKHEPTACFGECYGDTCSWYDNTNRCCLMKTLVVEMQIINRAKETKNVKIIEEDLSSKEGE